MDAIINDPIFEKSTQEPSPSIAEAAHMSQTPQEPSVQSTDAGLSPPLDKSNPDVTSDSTEIHPSTATTTIDDPLLIASLQKHPDVLFVPPLSSLPLEDSPSGIANLLIYSHVCMIINSLLFEVTSIYMTSIQLFSAISYILLNI